MGMFDVSTGSQWQRRGRRDMDTIQVCISFKNSSTLFNKWLKGEKMLAACIGTLGAANRVESARTHWLLCLATHHIFIGKFGVKGIEKYLISLVAFTAVKHTTRPDLAQNMGEFQGGMESEH